MNMMKYFTLASLAVCATGALADAADTLVSFSTTADYYKDGTPVVDGEWYALCWSPDGVFDGITSECKPYDPNDRVLLMAPLAKEGHCPFTVFEVDSKVAPKSGKYCVILMDTVVGGKPSPAKEGKREPATVNLAIASANYSINGSGPSGGVTPSKPSNPGWAVTDVNPETPAKIATIEVDDVNATITVENLLPGVRYNVKMGQDIKNISTYGVPTDGSSTSAQFIIKKDNANFFQLVPEPLSK